MRGNGWVGGLIRYIRRKDGHNAANTQQRRAKDEDRTAESRTCFYGEKGELKQNGSSEGLKEPELQILDAPLI